MILRIGLLMLNRSLGYEPGTADYISFSVMGMLAVLSIVFPIAQPIAYRRAYIGSVYVSGVGKKLIFVATA